MKKVINKGYTITVVSWENDADNYNTKSITVDSKEKAKAYYDMMQLCESENNQKKGIIKLGNVTGKFSEKQKDLMIDFMKNNPILWEGEKVEDDDHFIDLFRELSSELLGYSEYYECRVMESCTITYSDKDVSLEEIKF